MRDAFRMGFLQGNHRIDTWPPCRFHGFELHSHEAAPGIDAMRWIPVGRNTAASAPQMSDLVLGDKAETVWNREDPEKRGMAALSGDSLAPCRSTIRDHSADGDKIAETALGECTDGSSAGVVGRDAGTGQGSDSNAVGVARGACTRQWVDAVVIENENASVTGMGWDKTSVKATSSS